jgi:hypothetical protein
MVMIFLEKKTWLQIPQSPWRSRQTAHTLSFGYKHGCKASALAPPFGNAGHLL